MKSHPTYSQYSANELGEIYGPRGKIKPILHHTGYNVITVARKQFRWHRFVWECFNGIIEDKKLVINHIDGNKENNSLSNIELVSQSRNCFHAFENELRKGISGESHALSKITEAEAIEMIRLMKDGYTNKRLAELYPLHPQYISLIRHKRRWKTLWAKLDDVQPDQR